MGLGLGLGLGLLGLGRLVGWPWATEAKMRSGRSQQRDDFMIQVVYLQGGDIGGH